jgi:hypothetical protein
MQGDCPKSQKDRSLLLNSLWVDFSSVLCWASPAFEANKDHS